MVVSDGVVCGERMMRRLIRMPLTRPFEHVCMMEGNHRMS